MLWAEPVTIFRHLLPAEEAADKVILFIRADHFAKRSQPRHIRSHRFNLLAIRQHHLDLPELRRRPQAPVSRSTGGFSTGRSTTPENRASASRHTGDPQLTNKTGAKENRRRRMVEIFENNVRSGEGRVAAGLISASVVNQRAHSPRRYGQRKPFRIDYAAGPFSGAHRRLTTR